jgi:phage N-6-adenine-methyltransferase
MNNTLMFSSATDEWATPEAFFDLMHREFRFTLDVAATYDNAKCPLFLSDSLGVEWDGVCWCNPPYSRGLQGKFIAKAADERLRGVTTVMLLPARTDTKAFHAHIYDATRWHAREGVEIRFIPGRLKFGGAANSAPFPSMVVIFRP